MSEEIKKAEGTDQHPGELTAEALEQVTGGTPVKTISWSHDDETAKETVTFE
jgi:hypothetical protein